MSDFKGCESKLRIQDHISHPLEKTKLLEWFRDFKHNVLSFRTTLRSFETLGTTAASAHKTLTSPKLNSQFQTGNSCTGAGNGGYGCRSWDTIHNLVATGVAWTKERLPKKTVGHLQTAQNLIVLVSIHRLPSHHKPNCPLQSLFLIPRVCRCLASSSFYLCAQRTLLMRSAAGTAGRQTPWLQCQKVWQQQKKHRIIWKQWARWIFPHERVLV